MDIKKFIIEEFGLSQDVEFNKCPRITYFDIYELLTKYEKEYAILMEKFVLWLVAETEPVWDIDLTPNRVFIYENKVYSYSELFEYWYTNIELK